MATNDPVGTVQRMFAAFRMGDLDTVLDTVDTDTQWTYVGANPKLSKAELVGKAGVRRFFEGILKRLEVRGLRGKRIRPRRRHRRRIRRGGGNGEGNR